ncbi:PhzF family phenazine biosynthesis protein [Micromonospora craniellae]|uniref:PhzF family phenazine biosynthesis protein n=1 Tax=Micromonospora craniellae TaxID=2294034 RepID=A0A372FXW6_9ACTN|nr:PhzF family phenazine biosynthesis protein [Micromonospora craniellae]QOC93808.1 PhzF family phenazine biosynthesis protein [Micromonospora craniellae]RFS45647.1 PhzF family phenazine biosynthesis protein [Micromonospora craniellae]
MSTLAYEIVDVFTDRPYAGNPLAVVFGAEGLATEQMQALAREFNLSETVFVLPATQVNATYRARIFTPTEELPFAGHPSVGAAVTASRRGLFAAGQVSQECGAGVLPIEVTGDGATLTGGTPALGPEFDPEPLLEVAGLVADDHLGPAPRVAGCGLEFPFLPVRPDALARAEVNPVAARRYGIEHVSVFSWNAAAQTAQARVFVPGLGVPEDPATGSAALGLGVWLVASGLLPGEGRSSYTVRQGIEMGRPSTLNCTVTAAGGVALGASVAGQVMPVARGEILVPPFVG